MSLIIPLPIEKEKKNKPTSTQNGWPSQAPNLRPSLPSAAIRNQVDTITSADSKTSTEIMSTATIKINPVEEGKKELAYSSPIQKGETSKSTSIQNVLLSQAPTLRPSLSSAALRNQGNTITFADTNKINPVEEGKKEPDYSSPIQKGEKNKPTSIQNVWPSRAPTSRPSLSSAAIRNQGNTITFADTNKIIPVEEGKKEPDYLSPIQKGKKSKATSLQNVWPSRAPTLRPSLSNTAIKNQGNTITFSDTNKINPVEEGKKEPDYSSPIRNGEKNKPTSVQNVWPSQAPTLKPSLSSAAIRNQGNTITYSDINKINPVEEEKKEPDYLSPIQKGEKKQVNQYPEWMAITSSYLEAFIAKRHIKKSR